MPYVETQDSANALIVRLERPFTGQDAAQARRLVAQGNTERDSDGFAEIFQIIEGRERLCPRNNLHAQA